MSCGVLTWSPFSIFFLDSHMHSLVCWIMHRAFAYNLTCIYIFSSLTILYIYIKNFCHFYYVVPFLINFCPAGSPFVNKFKSYIHKFFWYAAPPSLISISCLSVACRIIYWNKNILLVVIPLKKMTLPETHGPSPIHVECCQGCIAERILWYSHPWILTPCL